MPTLNRVQRGIAIGAAVILLWIQFAGMAENGLDDSPGWMWPVLTAVFLLLLAFGSPKGAPTREATGSDGKEPMVHDRQKPTVKGTPSPEQMQRFASHMGLAIGLVNANGVGAKSLLDVVLKLDRYHRRGALALVCDPRVECALAVHAIFTIAVRANNVTLEPLVWETYRATLANRLADHRLEEFASIEVVREKSSEIRRDAEAKKAFVEQARQEMQMWEGIARKSGAPNDSLEDIVRSAAPMLCDRPSEEDLNSLRPAFHKVFSDAERTLPVLSGMS